ncbi:multicopper oxidase family protein [Salinirubrum litoreum]|uniref:Multicopper oxidase family protein n=1 Tax=Salinirubrum litoreum TaxID=1126234 RepID=A0ABD5RG92_9EURY|nr:multicopper oxidase domain-containing protein [Salinirubrum litoreum]
MSTDNTHAESQRQQTVPRRAVLKATAATGLFATVPWSARSVRAETTGPSESSLEVPAEFKWEDPLPRPGVFSPVSRQGGVERYDISMTQFTQAVLPTSMGLETKLWGYGGTYPASSIVARPGRPVAVTYRNQLPTSHLLSVDPRVHGAGEDAPEVRTAVHLHGGVTAPEFDGYPDAWVSPDGETDPDSPVGYEETMYYENEQEPTTLWYHDHAIGITRLNVYAGLAGFYLLREPVENSLPSGDYEIPILLQDRSFNPDGSLFYPDGSDDEFEAEFFGDVPVVNGKAYPYLAVEPRPYRFRILNGSNGRTFNLKLYNETDDSDTNVPLLEQIGVDLGFLDDVVTVGPGGMVPTLLLSGAERADVIVDFSGFEGQEFVLRNGAGIPYAGEEFTTPGEDPDIEVDMPEMLKIEVTKALSEADDSIPAAQFLEIIGRTIDRYDFHPPVTTKGEDRSFTLDSTTLEVAPGVDYDSHFLDLSLWSEEAAVVTPTLGTYEDWEFVNTTGDSHPIHLHLVDFEVVERRAFTWDDGTGDTYADDAQDYMDGVVATKPDIESYITRGGPNSISPNNRNKKDTVLVDPNEIVTVRVPFTGFAGRYVWHCHILEHEDQEMMLPYEVVAPTA